MKMHSKKSKVKPTSEPYIPYVWYAGTSDCY